MKINLKKVATVLGTALMLGSTAGMAAAASYSAPFVSSGVADVAIVVGSNAALSDGLAASAIAADLASDLAAQTASGTVSSGTSVTGGDSVKIEKTSDKFNYGDGIADIDSSLDKKDLPTLLADGTYLDGNNDEFEYKQTVALANLTLGLFDDDSYARDTPTVGFSVSEGTNVLNYTLDFTDTPKWENLQSTEMPIFGKTYYVLSTSGNSTITLLDSAVSAEIDEGETTTLKVGNTSYEISAKITSGSAVKLTVNGQTTNSLDESQTQRLSDGAYVGIKSISYGVKESQVSSVEFSIGSGKLILESGQDVELNDESIDNLAVTITNGAVNTALSEITLAWSAEEDGWITPTSSLEMPGFNTVKLVFAGMTYPASEKVVVKADGDDNLVLSNFPLAGGVVETINLLQSNGTRFNIVGKDSNNLIADSANGTSLVFTKNVDDYFAITYKSGEDGASYLVKAFNWNEDGTDPADNEVDFEYLTSSGWKSLDSAVVAGEDVTVGDASFRVDSISNESSSATVTITAGSRTYMNQLISDEGLTVYLPWVNTTTITLVNNTQVASDALACQVGWVTAKTSVPGTFASGYSGTVQYNNTLTNASDDAACSFYPATYQVNFTEEDKDNAIALGKNFSVSVGLDSQSEVYVTSVGGADSAYEVGESDVYVSYVNSALNTKIEDDQSGDHETVTITYHGGESFADVFVTAPSATVTAGSSSGASASSLGAITVTDAEVSSVSGKNLIVIGGSCVNSVAAELIGSAACGSAFTTATGIADGQAIIKSFSKSGKVALLVAGYNAADTAKAATYLTNNAVDTTVGKALKVTSATQATAITA